MTWQETLKLAYKNKKTIRLTTRQVKLLSKGRQAYVVEKGEGFLLIPKSTASELFVRNGDGKLKKISPKNMAKLLGKI